LSEARLTAWVTHRDSAIGRHVVEPAEITIERKRALSGDPSAARGGVSATPQVMPKTTRGGDPGRVYVFERGEEVAGDHEAVPDAPGVPPGRRLGNAVGISVDVLWRESEGELKNAGERRG
jgi:hypothetical protein